MAIFDYEENIMAVHSKKGIKDNLVDDIYTSYAMSASVPKYKICLVVICENFSALPFNLY